MNTVITDLQGNPTWYVLVGQVPAFLSCLWDAAFVPSYFY